MRPFAEFVTRRDAIDACVMECFVREHMAERDLLFHDELAPHLTKVEQRILSADSSDNDRQDCLPNVYRTLNAAAARIRNRRLRISADSPDLLAVIRREGKV